MTVIPRPLGPRPHCHSREHQGPPFALRLSPVLGPLSEPNLTLVEVRCVLPRLVAYLHFNSEKTQQETEEVDPTLPTSS